MVPDPFGSRSLVEVLQTHAAATPARVAFRYLKEGEQETASLTYTQLDQQARDIAAHLQSLATGPTQALLLYPPGLEFVAAFLGCLYAGVTAVPVYPPRPNQSLRRLESVAADCQATLALTTAALLPRLETTWPDNRAFSLVATDTVPTGQSWQTPALTHDSLAFLQYTSGSTGTPKGVMVTHGNILANSQFLRTSFELTSDSVSVTWLPSFHDMGLIDGILQPLYTGFLGVIMPPVAFLQTPSRWLATISRYRATHCGGPNFGYEHCIRKIPVEQRTFDLRSWVSAYNGAEPVSYETLERFVAAFSSCGFQRRFFYPCYGMAESTLIITGGTVADEPVYVNAAADSLEKGHVVNAAADQPRTRHLVSSGRTWLDTEVRIVNHETLELCPDGIIGEIWAAGSGIAAGYWQRPAQTLETFANRLPGSERNFLRTGDLGVLQNGELFVVGRHKDLIIVRGLNHYPQDIESSAENCHPGLRAGTCAAFGAELKGEERLIIIVEVERTHLRRFDTAAATAAIRERIALEHGVQVYRLAFLKPGSVPKTSSGKIQRHEARRRFLENELEMVPARDDPSESPAS